VLDDDAPRHAYIQRCTFTEIHGGWPWQCLQPDPHPSGEGHRFEIDARFGRKLDEQRPEWLAAQLRDQVAVNDHLQAKVNDLTAVASELAKHVAQGGPLGMSENSRGWILTNAPEVARYFRWIA